MSEIEAYYYIDARNREVFHVPKVFILIEPLIGPTEVILEPRKLKSRFRGLQRVLINGIRDVKTSRMPEKDIQRVIGLCFSHRKTRARKVCENLFDGVLDKLEENHIDNYIDELGYDPDGFDERYMGSLF